MSDYPATIPVLQQLVSQSLTQPTKKGNVFLKAIRAWFILESLYGQETNFQKNEFQYSDWRDHFFYNAKKAHINPDSLPQHDTAEQGKCLCQKTIRQLLELQESWEEWEEWKENIKNHYRHNSRKTSDEFSIYLQDLEELLENERPFNCTARTIKNNFRELVKKDCLNYSETNKTYLKLTENPSFLTNLFEAENSFNFFMDEDDSYQTLLDKLNHPINDVQRLFFYYDYKILSNKISKKVNYCRDELTRIWQKTPVPVVKLQYKSSSLGGTRDNYIIYPVCIFYYQRSFYLCAFGQFPKQKENEENNWYNYRLDGIERITSLEGKDNQIAADILEKSQEDQNELIQGIQDEINEAYGFDFYLEKDTMLLRFPKEFHKNYISHTVRHPKFRKLDHQQAIKQIKQCQLNETQREKLMTQVKNHPDDGYYNLPYRKTENSVIIRLRAWCPNVEVILPWDLRQRMQQDMQQTWELYKDDPV